MMDRYIDVLRGFRPERPSQDPSTQPANAAMGPQPYNAVSADHLLDYTPAVERHAIRSAFQRPERFDFKQLLEEWEPQQERVSPPSYVIVPGSNGPVAYGITNTKLSNKRPPLPTKVEDWADISIDDYVEYLPDILTWHPPPFIKKERHWTTIQETGDEAATFESLPALFNESPPARFVESPPARVVESPPARFVESPPARFIESPPARVVELPPPRFVESPPTRLFELPPARSVDSRPVNAPMWGHSSQMPVHTSGHIPVPPMWNFPTPAWSFESGPSQPVKRRTRSTKSTSTPSTKSTSAPSTKTRPERSVKPPAKRRYETYPPRMPLRPVPLVHRPIPLFPPILPPSAYRQMGAKSGAPMPLSAYAPLPPPVHSYYLSQFDPPVAHSTPMSAYPPAYMPRKPPPYMPLNPRALTPLNPRALTPLQPPAHMSLHPPVEVPEHPSVKPLNPSVRMTNDLPDLQNSCLQGSVVNKEPL